jgi:hypothetical protein
MAAARPFFEDLGRVMGAPPAREVVVCAGNHDHALLAPWLAKRALRASEPLGLEQRIDAQDASPMLAMIAEWASPARVTAAYPGLWVRPDVYATHGHYLDCHLTVPTIERLSVAAMSRVLRRPASGFDEVEDYEAVGAPMFAWRDAVARDARTGDALNGVATVSAWRALDGERRANGGSGRSSMVAKLRTRALVAAFPLAVAALNRAGLGPLRTDISTEELRRAGLRAMGEVAARLDLGAAYVIFGHTHRAGPLPGDHEGEWRGDGGARLINSGCWTYDSVFLTPAPGESPYWPGTCVLVEDGGSSAQTTPPVLKRLLLDRTHAELRPPARTAALTPSRA